MATMIGMDDLISRSCGLSADDANPDLIFDTASSALHSFLQPSDDLYTASLLSAKRYLDPLASSISKSHADRGHKTPRKRKRTENYEDSTDLHLQLLCVEEFTVNQIWEQATRIISATEKQVQRSIPSPSITTNESAIFDGSHENGDSAENALNPSRGLPGDDFHERLGIVLQNGPRSDGKPEVQGQRNLEIACDKSEIANSASNKRSRSSQIKASDEVYVRDPFGLNDGFFSIDDFNKQSKILERLDAKGDAESESDEEIDWHANPMFTSDFLSKDGFPAHEDELASNDAGSIKNLRINESVISDRSIADDVPFLDTNDIRYAQFFLPHTQEIPKESNRQSNNQLEEDSAQGDLQCVMADARRDIFDEDILSEDVEHDSAGSFSDTHPSYSSHERQRARISDKIRQLEAANITKKEWMLSGEVKATERPLNSIIEEALDFERTAKPVPVVTGEMTEEIEGLIKRRILAKEFDELIRRLPSSLSIQDFKKGGFELDDSKPQQSLGELYETEHQRTAAPGSVSSSDQKLQRAHAEVVQIWKEISSQLDSLSNRHYRPKVPHMNINVITDVPAVMMEEARPSANGTLRARNTLAPQEIYLPGEDPQLEGELAPKSGIPMAREEAPPKTKLRARRQWKAKRRIHSDMSKAEHRKTTEKHHLVSELKKGKVKIVGESGEMKNIVGSKVASSGVCQASGVLKL